MIVKQILPVNTIGNVWGTVWRICILMLRCEGLRVKLVSRVLIARDIIFRLESWQIWCCGIQLCLVLNQRLW